MSDGSEVRGGVEGVAENVAVESKGRFESSAKRRLLKIKVGNKHAGRFFRAGTVKVNGSRRFNQVDENESVADFVAERVAPTAECLAVQFVVETKESVRVGNN